MARVWPPRRASPPSFFFHHQLNNVTYNLTASEATIKNARALNGAWVSASMPVGDGVTGTAAYDLGAGKTSASLVAARKVGDRPLDLGVRWAEKDNAWSLEAGTTPARGHKLFAVVNPVTRAALGTWTTTALGGGVTAGVAHNFAKGATTLTASRPVGGDKVVASLSLPDRVAAVGWGRGPLRAGVKAKQLADGSFGRPSVSFSVDRSFSFDPVPAPAPPPPPPPKLSPLEWLDAQLSELGRSVKGAAVQTFERAKAA